MGVLGAGAAPPIVPPAPPLAGPPLAPGVLFTMRGRVFRSLTLATLLAPSCNGSQQNLEEYIMATFTTQDMSILVPVIFAVALGPK